MSLKAKLEAVIYAAEEPVTLAQMAAIFADEVLLAGEPEDAQIPLNGLVPEEAPSPDASDAPPEAIAVATEPVPQEAATPAAESAPEVAAEPENDESAAKKLAKLRDRKVRTELQKILDELLAEYAATDRGMEIREIAGGFRMATKPEYHDSVRGFVKSLKPPMKLSLQALETLAVIAYKQPVTAPEVSEIRGVDSGGVLGSLISRKLIATAGRKSVIGRPILYKTTKEFLLRFGLKDVNDLPSMEEFEKMAGELAESEAEIDASEAGNENAALVSGIESSEGSSENLTLEPEIVTESVEDAALAPEAAAESVEVVSESAAVTEETVADETVTEGVVTDEAAAEETGTEEATAEEAVNEEAVTEEPAAEEAVTDEPAAEEIVTGEPVAEEVVAEEVLIEPSSESKS
jgi:segregation and condensation protein B